MARPYIIAQEIVTFAETLIKNTQDGEHVTRALCVILAARRGLTSKEISNDLGIAERTVFKYRDELNKMAISGDTSRQDTRGGRYHCYMTYDEERKFFLQFYYDALKGTIITAPRLHKELNNKLGTIVAKSTLYRMMERHGWREVVPDTKHPKSDPEAQKQFKKKSLNSWLLRLKGM
jgi:transposase